MDDMTIRRLGCLRCWDENGLGLSGLDTFCELVKVMLRWLSMMLYMSFEAVELMGGSWVI